MSPLNLSSGARTSMYAPVVLAVTATVFLIGMVTLVAGWFPVQPSDIKWRLPSAVLLLGEAPQMSFMLMMIAFTALFAGYFGVIRWISVIALGLGGVVIVVVPLFGLDLLTARKFEKVSDVAKYTRNGLRVAGSGGLMGLVLVWAGWRGLAATKTALASTRRTKGDGLVVAQEKPARSEVS
jgi:hypothetical protein